MTSATETASKLLQDFSERTGLSGSRENASSRYLWTDAFAVKSFFALAKETGNAEWRKKAVELIDLVHYHLGRFHPASEKDGWISGLPEKEGLEHPTAGGLRIGKQLPEREKNETFSERLEWERDGQYFHYLTSWISTLLLANRETGEEKYTQWAAELLMAGKKFIVEENGQLRMYWKMSTDLSRSLVSSMGAHDPLEGLLCAAELQKTNDPGIPSVYQNFKKLCAGQDWTIADSLGTGGLLIAATKAAALENSNALPESSQPKNLLEMALTSLYFYRKTYRKNLPVNQRLAFRECGLSLGIRSLKALNPSISTKATTEGLEDFQKLAEEIEDFWVSSEVQQSSTWKSHLDINAVSLAASLVARRQPGFFPV